MCVIIHKPKGKTQISRIIIENAEFMNPDGFGITFLDTGETIMTRNYHEAWELVNEPRPFVAHYRYATVGHITESNCHPFEFYEGDGLLYSNGTVPLGNKTTTDTEVVAGYLDVLPRKYWGHLLSMTEARFAVLTRDHAEAKFKVERHGKWHKHRGVWYSKDDVLDDDWGYTFSGHQYKKSKATASGKRYPASSRQWLPSDVYTEKEELEEITRELDQYSFDPWDDELYEIHAPAVLAYGQPYEDDFDDWDGNHLIGVYGTLRHGHWNNSHMDGSAFIGSGLTSERLRMTVPSGSIPYVHSGDHEKGHQLSLEIYKVDDPAARAAIDGLEGHPYHYRRRLTDVQLASGESAEVWVYMVDDPPSKNARIFASYDEGVAAYTRPNI